MSSPAIHLIQSVSTSALLYPIIGENAIPFGLSIIFIDLDHIILYVIDTKSLNIKGFFTYFNILEKNLNEDYLGLNCFHTIEFYALVLLLANLFPVFYYILGGFLFHHLFDLISLIRLGHPFVRAFSIVEYFVRMRKNKYTSSIRGIFQKRNLDLGKISNAEKWLTKWKAI